LAFVLTYHAPRRSNGPTEAVNLIIEKIRRIGHGFTNYHNYRLRFLPRCALHLAYSPRRTKCEAANHASSRDPQMRSCRSRRSVSPMGPPLVIPDAPDPGLVRP